ncbi:hypothetical protein [Thermoflexus sp.]|uniref:hypothetical protein n=1 Tax=Thermoflexus sp. TaxID=1969742 RepID=UPI002ADE05BD|nr:hypothetical protein [Thermoflexus sp.]
MSFVELFRESVIIQGFIVLVMLTTVSVMLIMGISVPDQIWALVGLVVGYYFGSDRAATLRRLRSAS